MRPFTAMLMLFGVATASADVSMELKKADPNAFNPPLVNPPPDLIVWELIAKVPPGTTLLACECEFGVSGAWFLNEPGGSATAPEPSQFLLNPNLQMDTFVTSPSAYPNASSGNANVTLLPTTSFGGQQFASKVTRVAWSFNEPVGEGTWVVARFGVSLNAPIVYYKGCMDGFVTSSKGTTPFSLNIIMGGKCPVCIADITGDDRVCKDDLALLLSAFGTCEGDSGYQQVANLDSTPGACGMQSIDQADLGVLLSQFSCLCR